MRLRLLILLASIIQAYAGEAPFAEVVEIRSPHLTASLLLPDATSGRYRGPRFDWSGMMFAVRVGGNEFFAPWREPGDAAAGDRNAQGTAEEFGLDDPPGYDETAVGSGFPKIGVGLIARLDAGPYEFWRDAPILASAPWRSELAADGAVFIQDLPPTDGWGWHYEKRIRLDPARAAFAIERVLTNTGSRAIRTSHYCHHFTCVAGLAPDHRSSMTFSSPVEAGEPFDPAVFGLRDGCVRMREGVSGTVYARLIGDGRTVPFSYRLDHDDAAIGLAVTADAPVYRVALYIDRDNLCVEPFTRIDLAPGATMAWSTRYEFSRR